jgi:signal transduction histidine kinase
MERGEPFYFEGMIRRKDETLSWIEVHGQLELDPDGIRKRILGTMRDVTRVKKSEEALRTAEKLSAVGRLAASIAHEINNPLASVTNLLYLARTSDDLAEAHGFLDTAERELRRVSVISNQTLRFYRQPTEAQETGCNDLFENVLSIYQGRLMNSRVEVHQRMRAKLPLNCFEGEIRQVLSNLIGNAIDAMHGAGGRLLVRTREATNWRTGKKGLTLTVADTGVGMSKSELKKIFQPFFTTKGLAGTGLGLWVSGDIVKRHRGELRVRSRQQEGRSGTVFALFLPFDGLVR